MNRIGATAEAIKFEFLTAVRSLTSEQIYRAVQVGEEIVPVKPTDAYFVAIMMAFFAVIEKRDVEGAYITAMNVLGATISGDQKIKREAGQFMQSCVQWHHAAQAKDAVNSDNLVRTCQKYAKTKFESHSNDSHSSVLTAAEIIARPKSVSEFLEAQRKHLPHEQPSLIINLGTRKAALRQSDIHFISGILAFVVCEGHLSQDEALHYAILTFVLIHDGNEKEKKDAHTTANSACQWAWSRPSDASLLTADQKNEAIYQLHCAKRLKDHFRITI